MTEFALLPLMAYAACGLVLSLAVHLLSFFGILLGGDKLFFALHIGIFPLWIPVVLIMQKLGANSNRKETWKAMLSGCPPWMGYMVRGFFIYAIVNFVIFFILAATSGKQTGGPVPTAVWHGFSGHWMAFYAAGLAALTTAYNRGLSNLQRRCPNGHLIGFNDKFCPTCGAAIAPES